MFNRYKLAWMTSNGVQKERTCKFLLTAIRLQSWFGGDISYRKSCFSKYIQLWD